MLDLRSNLLTGSIATNLVVMSSLRSLNLADNDLEGHLPNVRFVEHTVAKKALSGRIPEGQDEFVWFNPSLFSLNLGNNALTGPIPRSLYMLIVLSQ